MQRLLFVVVLILAVSSVWSWYSGTEKITANDALSMAGTLIGIKELWTRRRRNRRPSQPFRLTPSFSSGVHGGLIGGGIAGLIIGPLYYFALQDFYSLHYPGKSAPAVVMAEVFAYACLVGLFTGAGSQFAILLMKHKLPHGYATFGEIIGGVAGGFIGGAAIGVVGGSWFGGRGDPAVNPNLLLWGALAGTIFVVIGALLYEYDGRWRNVAVSIVISTAILPVLAVTSVAAGGDWVNRVLTQSESEVWAGAQVGAFVGAVLGLEIGLALWMYRIGNAPVGQLGSSRAGQPG